jgi:CDP-diacylglycerol--serine O-phosphatidyltransferase
MKVQLKKGIYILPSLFTCGNMTFGFLSMLMSIRGNFTAAAWFIVCGIACDALDGRIARLTKTTSEFGVQLDSLADLVTFGLSPAMLMYKFVLEHHPLTEGKVGIAIAVLFVLCSALRLAKFNVQASDGAVHRTFMGLPTPASAGVIISFVVSYELWVKTLNQPSDLVSKSGKMIDLTHLTSRSIPILMKAMPVFMTMMPIVMIILSFLMVSNVPYQSFKKLKLSKPVALPLMFIIIILVLITIAFPQNIFFFVFSAYALSGLILYIPNRVKAHREKKNEGSNENNETEDGDCENED